jgi:hypothetical protein
MGTTTRKRKRSIHDMNTGSLSGSRKGAGSKPKPQKFKCQHFGGGGKGVLLLCLSSFLVSVAAAEYA